MQGQAGGPIRFCDTDFAPDFTRARRDDGADLTFTRGESQVLAILIRNAGRVVTRNQVLDAMSDVGSDKSDRNVDYMINRLRRKLADSPRDPRFIATRYGDGYVWLPRPAGTRPLATGAHAVVGPVRGYRHLGDAAPQARRLADLFQARFAANFGADRKVVFDPDCPPPSAFREGAPQIGVEMTFLRDSAGLECIVHATAFRSGMTYSISRHRIPADPARSADLPDAAAALATRLAAEIWKSLTLTASRREPLAVAMHNAAQSIQGGLPGWAESHRRLQQLAADSPDDHAIQIMLAANIHSKYVQHGMEILSSGPDTRAEDEARIEALVTANLPHVQHDPFLAATAAKLLFFIDRGYRRMAMDLIEEVHRTSAAVAPSLVILGMLRTFAGQIDDALSALDQAQEMAEPGSELEVYILCLKCQTLMATHDRAGLDAVLARLYALRPPIQFVYDLLYGPEQAPSPAAAMALQQMTPEQARGLLIFTDYMCGRFFAHEDHRRNTLRVPMALLTRHFGPGIVPEEVLARTAAGPIDAD